MVRFQFKIRNGRQGPQDARADAPIGQFVPLVANEAISGFRMTDTPLRIFSTVRLFGRAPGLINSMRLSNIMTRHGAEMK